MPFVRKAQFSMANTVEWNHIRTYAPQFKIFSFGCYGNHLYHKKVLTLQFLKKQI